MSLLTHDQVALAHEWATRATSGRAPRTSLSAGDMRQHATVAAACDRARAAEYAVAYVTKHRWQV